MVELFLFLFGLAVGSFFNVVALRYDGTRFLFDPRQIGGRSHCPHCKRTLRWFELLPVVSFIIQSGRCRRCGVAIGWQYPIVELLSGFIFLLVAMHFSFILEPSVLWIIVFEIFLLIAYIDILLGIIPDELNIALILLGLFEIFFFPGGAGAPNLSFFGPYASIFGFQGNILVNHLLAAIVGAAFFGSLVAITRGKGMGMGDVKLAFPLGLLFGWPDIVVISLMAFVIGGIFGVGLILSGEKTMKSAVPFGPFLVVACVVAFFFGSALFGWYFHMIGL
jgi:prepilin signal peptidase PulO-like enzyme (type II secretory pathway)